MGRRMSLGRMEAVFEKMSEGAPTTVGNTTFDSKTDPQAGSDRYELFEPFLQRPALNAVAAAPLTNADASHSDNDALILARSVANRNFEVAGSGATTALVTFDHDYPGITLTTGTSDNHEMMIQPHEDTNQSAWGLAGIWDSQNEVEWSCAITTGGTITTYSIFAGLKLTDTGVYATDTDQAYFVSCTDDDLGAFTSNGNLHFVHSIGGTDYISDLGITLAADTTYRLKIKIDSSRQVSVYVNGAQYSLTSATTAGGVDTGKGTDMSAALTNNKALIPIIGVRAHAGSAARALRVHYQKISRKLS